jgi:hypothetical protein
MQKDAILFWNEVSIQAHANDHTGPRTEQEQPGPAFGSRALAIVHAAMYDAANSFYRTRQPYMLQVDGILSVRDAIAGAAHASLSLLYPKRQLSFLKEQLDAFGINDKISFEKGADIGQKTFSKRVNDGSELNRTSNPDAFFPNASFEAAQKSSFEEGEHRPDPNNPKQGLYATKWGQVIPFAIKDLLTVIPSKTYPDFVSDHYRKDFNEVKLFGSDISKPRTPEQTEIGIYWAYDGVQKIGTPVRLYNQIARRASELLNLTEEQNARYFLLINLVMADAGIHTWHAKYKHFLWRPIVGIRYDIRGGADPAWNPLGSPNSNSVGAINFTPNFPAYPSGHATFGTAAFTIIKLILRELPNNPGDKFEIRDFVSDEFNGETIDNLTGKPRPKRPRSFTLDKAIQENLESRIYLGVHWRFDGDEGERVGKEIAAITFKTIALKK